MNLQEAVSNILKRNVSIEEAKEFAYNQFGVLSTYIKENADADKEQKKQNTDSLLPLFANILRPYAP